MKTLKQLSTEFLTLKSALIFCHIRPDGDTLGSAVALALALRQKGIKCSIMCEGIIPERLAINSTFNEILGVENFSGKYDAHISVDIASEHLFGRAWGIYESAEKKYAIDHHTSNSRFTSNLYLESAPATAIIVYKLLEEMQIHFTKEICESLLMGIVTDTGNFMHNYTNAECMKTAGKLMEYGADLQKITCQVFKNQSKGRSDLYLSVMQKSRFYLDGKLVIIAVHKNDLKTFGVTESETEGFVDYPLTISGVEVAVSVLEFKNELYRVSFRSKGKVNVNSVANEFGGGGHLFASGCVIAGLYEEVIEKIIRAVDINIY